MTDIKKKIEQYFIDNWTDTPIQFEGTAFTAPSRWIKLDFIPMDRKLYAIGLPKGRKKDIMTLKISCFDISTTLSMSLEDDVRAFIECLNIDDLMVGIGIPSGDGSVPLDNDVWISVSTYNIEKYN